MTATTQIPTALVQRAAGGDADAQTWLYVQFSKAMFNICIRFTGNHAYAEDLLQEAFITAFKNLHQLKQPEAFGGWLKQIVIHTCIQQYKKKVQWEEWVAEDHEDSIDEQEAWWQHISLADLHREIKQLPDGCRQVFVLYAMEEYTHRDIAAHLGITEGTSKSQYHRARKILREKITAQLISNG
ncbi:MAG: RNA polymerase sigma factor [Bacteroidetes bacterium]|nr:RNA polymerase sigma factor [Bacteroidota bacterium]